MSLDVIKPILQGRDIKPFTTPSIDKYLLFIPWHFPLHEQADISGVSKEAELLFKNKYPAIYKHLLAFKKQLLSRNAAETGKHYEWYAMQRWAANYWQEFIDIIEGSAKKEQECQPTP